MDGPVDASDTKPSVASAIVELPKVLRNICSRLLAKQELLNMALSCKTISPIALDMMWTSQSSMKPLLAPLRDGGYIPPAQKIVSTMIDEYARIAHSPSLPSSCPVYFQRNTQHVLSSCGAHLESERSMQTNPFSRIYILGQLFS
jgi:hypothetical protein